MILNDPWSHTGRNAKNFLLCAKHKCPWRQQSQNMVKSLCPTFWPCPIPRLPGEHVYDVSEVWATITWIYSSSLVIVSPLKLISGIELWTNGQTYRWTEDLIARCPDEPFRPGQKITFGKIIFFEIYITKVTGSNIIKQTRMKLRCTKWLHIVTDYNHENSGSILKNACVACQT